MTSSAGGGAAPGSADLAAAAASVQADAVARHRRLQAAARRFAGLQQQWQALARAELRAAQQSADTAAARQQAEVAARTADSQQLIAATLHRQAGLLAPGPMSLPWDAPGWADARAGATPRPASWIRVGSVPLPHEPAPRPFPPALVPLLDTAGWSVQAAPADAADLITGVLLRLLATVPAHRLEVTVFDPRLELPLGQFQPVREASRSTLPPALTSAADAAGELERVVDGMVRVAEELSAAGVRSVGEHWAIAGSLELTYRLIVVAGYPHSVTRAVQDLLMQVAGTAGTRGATLLVHRDPGASSPVQDVNPWSLLDRLTSMSASRSVLSVAGLPDTAVANDGPPPRELVDAVVRGAATAGSVDRLPSLPLSGLVEAIPEPWSDAEPEGIRAVFGREGRRGLELRLWSANPPLPNALIGGATGQGKSNLLLAIIHALGARYRPDQLRMYLLDFRQGVELSSLGPTGTDPVWLPHAEVLGLESDREFGLSVLEHLVAQFPLRSDQLTSAGCKSIVEYARQGLPGMPRLLLVVDEFQMLLDGDDEVARRSTDLLDQIARQGRGYGVHAILASQTISGIRGLAVKGDAIFGQFPNRLSLKNTAPESQAILGQGNTAAADLAYRGEIIVNENFGDQEANRRGVVALADEAYLADLRRDLFHRSEPRPRPPLVFFGARPVPWDDAAVQGVLEDAGMGAGSGAGAGAGGYRAHVARPVAVETTPLSIPFAREADQAVLIAGSREPTGAGVLSAMMASVAVQAHRPTRWILLDGSTSHVGGEPPAPWLAQAIAVAEYHGHDVLHVPRSEIRLYLAGAAGLLDQRTDADPDVFVWAIAPQRVPDLATAVTDEFGGFRDPVMTLQRLVREGGPRGVFLVGWWVNMRTAIANLGFGTPGVGAHVLFDLSREDTMGLIDPRIPMPAGSPRLMVKDPRATTEVRAGIPYEPLTAQAARALSVSRGRP